MRFVDRWVFDRGPGPVELRDIEIFLVLAEELHFGRTAERLHVSRPRVSQAIKQQERRIGAELFTRTSRTVQLTDVGRQLREDLRPVYAGLQASMERARLAARGISAKLRINMMPFNVGDLHPYWKAFRARHPQWGLQVRQAPLTDVFGPLRSGTADVLVVWLPVNEPDFTVGPTLCVDSRVLAVAGDHPLAGRDSVPVELFADFPHATAPDLPDYWEDSYLPFHTPKGRTIERVSVATTADDLIGMVGMGEIIQSFPGHVTRYWNMPHLHWLPVPDLPPMAFALVWRTEAENDLVRALAATVDDLGPHHF